jgi:amidase
MTKNVLDAATLLQATAGYDGIDDRQLGAPVRALVPKYALLVLESRSEGVRGLKIGILKEGMNMPYLEPEVDAVVRSAIAKFAELGAIVEEVSVPLHGLIEGAMTVINKLGATQTRQGRQCARRGLYINGYFEKLLPWTQEKWDEVTFYTD